MTNYLDKFKLDGKNAVITGGNGILGGYFSEGLLSAGANLVMIDKLPEVCEKAETLQKKFGKRCLGIACDITDPLQVEQAIQQAASELGDIHILLNNAAWKSQDLNAFFASFETYSLETWRQIMSVNIDGMFLVAQAVARHMIERNISGSIVQTASIYGIMGPDQRIYEGSFYMGGPINTPAVYSASKASVVGLTQYLATYLAKHKIRVNTLTPGGVESGQNDVFKTKYANRIPLGRMAKAEEMVGALIYLASDASSYVTGQNLVIDGGLSAW